MGIQLCSVRMSGELTGFRIVLGEKWTIICSALSNTRELNKLTLFTSWNYWIRIQPVPTFEEST